MANRNIPRSPGGVSYYAPDGFLKSYTNQPGYLTFYIDLKYIYNYIDSYNVIMTIDLCGLSYAYGVYGIRLFPVDESTNYLFTDYNFFNDFKISNYTIANRSIELKKEYFYVKNLGYLRYLWFVSSGVSVSFPTSFTYNLGANIKFDFYSKSMKEVTIQ